MDNNVHELVDMRKTSVLTVKTDKDGQFLKCKVCWVLKGFLFQDKQELDQQTDSPTSTRPGFRMTRHLAGNQFLDLCHLNLNTDFFQGESYDVSRNVVCQLPPEAGYPSHIGARLKRPTYGQMMRPDDGGIDWMQHCAIMG